MAHKPLIDGTAYEISGGKALIDGTAFSIKNGKTLIDGTAYEVGLLKDCTLSIKWSNHNVGSYVTIGGTKYSSSFMSLSQEVVVPVGTEVVVTCTAVWSYGAKISFNGTTVKQVDKTGSTSVDAPIEYTFVAQNDTSIEFNHNVNGVHIAAITES